MSFLDPPAPDRPPGAAVGQDGGFAFENICPERYSVTVAGLPAEYYVKSIRAGEQDALAGGLDLRKDDDRDVCFFAVHNSNGWVHLRGRCLTVLKAQGGGRG